MRARCLAEMAKVPGLEVVVPDEKMTKNGVVRGLADALETFCKFNGIQVIRGA